MNDKKRYYTLDIARAIAIVLVVIGHYYEPSMPGWYSVVHNVIYMFHMPLFMFISGFLYLATRRDSIGYGDFLRKKFRRIVIPYFTASIIILLVKLATQGVLPVEHPVTVADFVSILYRPSAGYFLWFLWALWWTFMIIPLFKSTRARLLLLCIALILHYMTPYITDILCLRELCSNLVYFVTGTLSFDVLSKYKIHFSRYIQFAAIIVFILPILALYNYLTTPSTSIILTSATLLLALAGIAMSLSVSNMLNECLHGRMREFTLSVSLASFFIYQYHTMFEGFAKGVINKSGFLAGSHPDLRYTVAIVAVVTCGVLIPYLLDRKLLSRYRLTRLIFGL